jgi:GMP synthase-like glutamine amidotransferase
MEHDMSLLVFQHQPTETPAEFGNILRDYGHKLRVIKLHEGQSVPTDLDDVDGVISLGGSMNVDEVALYGWIETEAAYLKLAHEAGKPIVGICLGAQLIAHALGGKVTPMATPEVGFQNVKLAFPGTTETLYQGIAWDTMQFHLHGQEVSAMPPGAVPLAGSKMCKTQAFKVGLRTYAFQYHFEWDSNRLKAASRDPLVEKAGVKSEDILAQIELHYDSYRRLGNRLSETIAVTLFPIDKR